MSARTGVTRGLVHRVLAQAGALRRLPMGQVRSIAVDSAATEAAAGLVLYWGGGLVRGVETRGGAYDVECVGTGVATPDGEALELRVRRVS